MWLRKGDSEETISWEMVGARVRLQAPLINVMLFQGEKDEQRLLETDTEQTLLCLVVDKKRSLWRSYLRTLPGNYWRITNMCVVPAPAPQANDLKHTPVLLSVETTRRLIHIPSYFCLIFLLYLFHILMR
jgi:hypothetical protein